MSTEIILFLISCADLFLHRALLLSPKRGTVNTRMCFLLVCFSHTYLILCVSASFPFSGQRL